MITYQTGFSLQTPALDANNLPVSQGRYLFTEVGSTTVGKPVYSDIDHAPGHSLGYKLELGPNGQPTQPYYYGPGPYDVMLQRYVSGDISLDASWQNVWTYPWTVSGGDQATTSGAIGAIATVNSRADLKTLNASSNLAAVVVLGYWSPSGDKSMLYRWDALSQEADNLGTCAIPNTAPATGRWLYVPQSGTDVIDACVFGLGFGRTNPCDTYLIAAASYCATNGLTLEFNKGVHYMQSSYPIACRAIYPEGFSFESTGFAYMTVAGPGSRIDSRSNMTGTLGNIQLQITDPFMDEVYPEWWGGMTPDYIQLKMVSAGCYGKKIIFSSSTNFTLTCGENIVIDAPCEFHYGATITQDFEAGYNLIINGRVTATSGKPWNYFPFDNFNGFGTVYLGPNHDAPVEASWFGWGYNSGDNSSYLVNAANCARGSGKDLHVSSLAIGDGIGGAVNLLGMNVEIDGSLRILSGGALQIEGIKAQRRRIFTYESGAANDAVLIYSGTVYPQWFGAAGNGSTDDTTALSRTIISCASGSTYPVATWVDGGGSNYKVTNLTVSGLSYVGVKDAGISSTATGNVLAFSNCSNFRMSNVSVNANSATQSGICVTMNGCSSFLLEDVNVVSQGKPWYVGMYGCTDIKFVRGVMAKSVGAFTVNLIDDDITNNGVVLDGVTVATNATGRPNGTVFAGYNYEFRFCTFQQGDYGSGVANSLSHMSVGNESGYGRDHYWHHNKFINTRLWINVDRGTFSHNEFWRDARYTGITMRPLWANYGTYGLRVTHNKLHTETSSSLVNLFIDYDRALGTYNAATYADWNLCVGENDAVAYGGFSKISSAPDSPFATEPGQRSWATYKRGSTYGLAATSTSPRSTIIASDLIGNDVVRGFAELGEYEAEVYVIKGSLGSSTYASAAIYPKRAFSGKTMSWEVSTSPMLP